MVKNKKNLFNFCFFFIIIFCLFEANANKITNFLSLKNNKVYLRQGPSFEYPIKFTYKKKYLPVAIIDKSENWRKIKDFQNNSGWIHISQLSKRKTAINTVKNSIIYKKSTIYSKPIVKLDEGRLVLIEKCKIKWCKITTGNYKGWIFKKALWGII